MKKLVFLGPAGVGKSSLRKFYFEGVTAKELVEDALEPTRGIEYTHYDHVFTVVEETSGMRRHTFVQEIPLDVNVLDAAGQELATWLEVEAEDVFSSADIIFVMFDVSEWLDESKRGAILDMILNVYTQRGKFSPDAFLYIIGNKFDKVPEGDSYRESLRTSIKKELVNHVYEHIDEYFEFQVFITSLVDMKYDTMLTMANLTSSISASPLQE